MNAMRSAEQNIICARNREIASLKREISKLHSGDIVALSLGLSMCRQIAQDALSDGRPAVIVEALSRIDNHAGSVLRRCADNAT